MTADLSTISRAAMQLSAGERLRLAQTLWNSLPEPRGDDSAEDSITTARRRARELAANPQLGIPHEEVMESVREALR